MSMLGKRGSRTQISMSKGSVKVAINPLQSGGAGLPVFKPSMHNQMDDESKIMHEDGLFFDEIDPNKSVLANRSMVSDGFVQLSTLIEDYAEQLGDNLNFDQNFFKDDLKAVNMIIPEVDEVQANTRRNSQNKINIQPEFDSKDILPKSRAEIRNSIESAMRTTTHLIDNLPTKKKSTSKANVSKGNLSFI